MTFANQLEELRKAATPTNSESVNRVLMHFLANNADAILELVRAAEVMVGRADGDDLEAELRAITALNKLDQSA